MEKYLKDTYGITVFQEQVMLLSRLLGNFTRGQSDTLRKAMGKKVMYLMEKLKVQFVDGCLANPAFMEHCTDEKHAKKLIEKIWKDWEAFASYAFNKSHSVCYAHIAYQTGYLKAHYPAEFMAANLSRNLNNITDITKLMTECNRMKLNVLGPDVNESFIKFTANHEGNIRFGMGAIKGVGAGAAKDVIKARENNGNFKTIYDFVETVNLQSVNKKNLEALAMAGAFDNLGEDVKRSRYFAGNDENDSTTFIEKLIKYGNKIQNENLSMQQSLFGDLGSGGDITKPPLPDVPEWPKIILLEKEKNLIGIYLTAHPLDDYKLELESFCARDVALKDLNNDIEKYKDREFTIGGMVTAAREGTSKNGNPYSTLTLSDYTDSYEFFFFGQDYVNFHNYCKMGLFLMVKGTVRTRFKSDAYEFKITHIELLSEARKNYVKSVTLTIPLDKLNNQVIEEIEKLAKNNKGKALLKFNVYDPESNLQVNLFSRTTKVDLSDTFLKFFEELQDIEYRIN
ncbi:MAG TPA: OB-fold nucleic acid binding domain-containing protein, partial [Prolixibacteraceae bacterium]|nr:OB-fold nucleic acid binding domain-containing protein [Prolixibacteraceae bacterium]